MFYTIYKTTNSITNEFYVGQHATSDLDDGYLGSGVDLLQSVKKYGKENFIKEILYIFDTEEEMNNKEIEIVDESFLSNPLVLNKQPGGWGLNGTRKSVVVFDEGRWKRISGEKYNPLIHITPTTGTVCVFDIEEKVNKRVSITEYKKNKSRYEHNSKGTICVFDIEENVNKRVLTTEYKNNKTRYRYHSMGRVSVLDKKTNTTLSISLDEYDPKRYKKVLGGIVAEVEGVLQYVTKEQFATNNLKGCHSNKVTVLDNNDKKRKHVTREEYYNNPNRYSHLSKGRVTVYDKIEKTYLQIPVEELLKQPERYLGTTSGQRTVWDIETKQFKNIPKQFFDRQYHRLASDKHILCYDPSGKILINFWGSKKDFVKIYGLELYNQALKETKNYQPKQRHRFSTYVGCSFKLIDWRN